MFACVCLFVCRSIHIFQRGMIDLFAAGMCKLPLTCSTNNQSARQANKYPTCNSHTTNIPTEVHTVVEAKAYATRNTLPATSIICTYSRESYRLASSNGDIISFGWAKKPSAVFIGAAAQHHNELKYILYLRLSAFFSRLFQCCFHSTPLGFR